MSHAAQIVETAPIVSGMVDSPSIRSPCNTFRDSCNALKSFPIRTPIGGSYSRTGTQIGTSRWTDDAHARVPSKAASVAVRPSRLDGDTLAHRLRVPIQTRCEKRKVIDHSRYRRVAALVNLRRSTRRAGKVEHMSCALCLMGATHLRYMPSKHPFMLELAS